jgi:hypothetical protein
VAWESVDIADLIAEDLGIDVSQPGGDTDPDDKLPPPAGCDMVRLDYQKGSDDKNGPIGSRTNPLRKAVPVLVVAGVTDRH